MKSSLRKVMVQVGVVLFIFQYLFSSFGYVLYALFGLAFSLLYLFVPFGMILLFIAALMPAKGNDSWGSMWPLVGYDNAIDGIYTRGAWMGRFQELEQSEEYRRITAGIATLFGSNEG